MPYSLSLTVFALGVLVFLRNELIFRIRMRRLNEVKKAVDANIDREDFVRYIDKAYSDLDSPTYKEMVFDLRKWTYKQFYPNPVE